MAFFPAGLKLKGYGMAIAFEAFTTFFKILLQQRINNEEPLCEQTTKIKK